MNDWEITSTRHRFESTTLRAWQASRQTFLWIHLCVLSFVLFTIGYPKEATIHHMHQVTSKLPFSSHLERVTLCPKDLETMEVVISF